MGLMPGLPRRRSMEDRSSSRTRRSIFAGGGSVSESESLDADDFADVFGGPPRSLLAHKFSRTSSFYEEIFRPPEFLSPATKGGRNLPVFRIPTKNEGFYSDIFGSDDDRKSRERSGSHSKAKSKSNSSSVLSSEELSPARPAIGDDVALSAFASKLRYWSGTATNNSAQSVMDELTFMPLVNRYICRYTLALGANAMTCESVEFIDLPAMKNCFCFLVTLELKFPVQPWKVRRSLERVANARGC